MIYLISDTHFCQKSIIPYCKRPFGSIDEMNEKIIENWNSIITNKDTVYFLGDFSFGTPNETRDICNRLNGYKIIIRGNHDRDTDVEYFKEIGFSQVFDTPQRLYYTDQYSDMKYVILSHEPQYINDNEFNIHGHIHDSLLSSEYPDMNQDNHLCVCVERINYTPILFDNIQEDYLEDFFNRKED